MKLCILGSLILLALVALTETFQFIPKASLAAVIICSVIFTIEFEEIPHIWHSKSKLPFRIFPGKHIFLHIPHNIVL